MHKILKKLDIFADRGSRGLPLERLYRELFNPEFFLKAYAKIRANDGAMTPGVTEETVDGMSVAKIHRIIETIRDGTFAWSPTRRTYIPKKDGKRRPLGLPTWTDKLLQEVIRMILEAYYEPQFLEFSHGFRPGRGCHTALTQVQSRFTGATWFIEGDIKGCFDNIDHSVLLDILSMNIRDNRFLQLIADLLEAGYMEDWQWNRTYSGTPQGGVLSPLLSNICLDRLDRFVIDVLQPEYTRGKNRRIDPRYKRISRQVSAAKANGDPVRLRELKLLQRTLPSTLGNDTQFRRLYYVRYADDFILGFSGPKSEALTIKERLQEFLSKQLKLELSAEKTLVTHALTKKALFLGYEIGLMSDNNRVKTTKGRDGLVFQRRTIQRVVWLGVPSAKLEAKMNEFKVAGNVRGRLDQVPNSDFSIVAWYQSILRGYSNYYRYAHNRAKAMWRLTWVMQTSLLKTLAKKYKTSIAMEFNRLRSRTLSPEGKWVTCLRVIVPREGKRALIAVFGGIAHRREVSKPICDAPRFVYNTRSELLERLLRDECELCGSNEDCNVHRIRKIADLEQKRRTGKLRSWEVIMLTRRRKTLILCRRCHMDVHMGRYDGTR
ncbi:MAG: reverse transcriptase domain-containing protein [Planctomycetota bacterium]